MLIGMTRAKKIMMEGTWVSVEEAKALGLVNAIYEPAALLPAAIGLAAELSERNPETMRLMKQVMNAPLRHQLDSILAAENRTIVASVKSLGGSSILSSL